MSSTKLGLEANLGLRQSSAAEAIFGASLGENFSSNLASLGAIFLFFFSEFWGEFFRKCHYLQRFGLGEFFGFFGEFGAEFLLFLANLGVIFFPQSCQRRLPGSLPGGNLGERGGEGGNGGGGKALERHILGATYGGPHVEMDIAPNAKARS